MFKKIMYIVCIVCFCVLLYQFIGNLYRAINGVKLIGDKNAYFVGYYIIAGVYFIFLILDVLIFLILMFCKRKRKI